LETRIHLFLVNIILVKNQAANQYYATGEKLKKYTSHNQLAIE
jgi:hypothetical protein